MADAIMAGDRLAIARLLTQIENQEPDSRNTMDALFPHTGQAYLVGITGSPGTGKSSLVNQLIHHYRNPACGETLKQVAVIAIDASSPYSGGAVLGDRIRMRSQLGDSGVFIRSMSARGALGGLASTTSEFVNVLDAAGFNIILIETVGVGQSEVDIAQLAHTTIVVESPGLGDDIQALKAGIIEIADIFLINKADHPGVDIIELALRSILDLASTMVNDTIGYDGYGHLSPAEVKNSDEEKSPDAWIPPIIKTIATQDIGILDTITAISNHRQYLLDSGCWKFKEMDRFKKELDSKLAIQLMRQWNQKVPANHFETVLNDVVLRNISPDQAINHLVT